jgi:hypothetical protein
MLQTEKHAQMPARVIYAEQRGLPTIWVDDRQDTAKESRQSGGNYPLELPR